MKIEQFATKLYQAYLDGATDKALNDLIFDYISNDENILPAMIGILQTERVKKRQLLLDTNLELSMALATMDSFHNYEDQRISTIQRIKAHYHKVSDQIKCAFRINGVPE